MVRRAGSVFVLAAALSLLIVSAAMGATRYAAPGGTGKDPCANPSRPCSVFTAADENAPRTTIAAGDVVELAPGTYYVKPEGEFGYENAVTPPEGVTIRGEPGKARPVVVHPLRGASYEGAFSLGPGTELADVELRNRSERSSTIDVWGGTLERVIVRSADTEATCNFSAGIIRSSVCLNSGGGPAIGVNVAWKGTFEGVIRNSTLIATGPGSVGMEFIYHAFKRGLTADIDAIGVVVEGEEKDVIARGLPLNKGEGADVRIELRNSSYETVETEAKAGAKVSVTRPGTNGNITATPLLADGYLHQLPGSPTIDKGAVDGASGVLDVDGQPRTLGGVPDIGADEFGSFPAQANSAPVTRLVGPTGKKPLRTLFRRTEFSFGSSDIDSRFECKLDRRPYRACTSPYAAKVGLGRHTFRVRAVDPQGLADETPAAIRWQVLPRRFFLP